MTYLDKFSEKENSSEKLNKRKIVHNKKIHVAKIIF